MKVIFHRLLSRDIRDTMRYYEMESGPRLADDFYDEFISLVRVAAEDPERFHFDESGLRRANLRRFPFHFLYRIGRDSIRVLVLRHHKRKPGYGLGRSWR